MTNNHLQLWNYPYEQFSKWMTAGFTRLHKGHDYARQTSAFST